MDEITGGRGVVFATGTPVSNSMTELYTMQRLSLIHICTSTSSWNLTGRKAAANETEFV